MTTSAGRFFPVLEVWAPKPREVEAVLEDASGRHTVRMGPAGGGWWRLIDERVRPGLRYGFVLDGEGPFPDPRSRRQPEGVHALSEVVDPGAFSFREQGFRAPPLGAGLVYELHVGTFSPEGTFAGAALHLDHLVDLGVTHVELMPVAAFSGRRGWGYDGTDWLAPHEPYGGPQGLVRFVDACHARGLAVILDVVFNHQGPEGSYLERYGPYLTRRYQTPWGRALNLDDEGSDEVRRLILDSAEAWLRDYRVDGLRLDAVETLYDRSARHLLEELAERVAALSVELARPLVLIAESDLNDPRVVRPREAGGYGLDAQWSDDFHHALHAVLTGERSGYYADFGRLAHLEKALTRTFVYDGQLSRHRGRRHGRPVLGIGGHRFLVYAQTHDQVGNRARGERLSGLVSTERQMIAAALVATSPYVPMIFQGEEWGASTPFQYFTDHGDAALGEAVRAGRRREFAAFGWAPHEVPDPQAEDTFLRSRLAWGERSSEPHASLLAFTRALYALRRARPSLLDDRQADVRVRIDEDRRWLSLGRGDVAVLVNLGPAQRVPVLLEGPHTLLLASVPAEGRRVDPDAETLELPPDAVWIVGRQPAALQPGGLLPGGLRGENQRMSSSGAMS